MANKEFVIKVSRTYIVLLVMLGLLCIAIGSISNALNFFYIIGLILIFNAIMMFFAEIIIVNKDAKYKGIFKRTSIKDIESVDCSGFWIINKVCIYGRGRNKISLGGVNNFNIVRKYAENIEGTK